MNFRPGRGSTAFALAVAAFLAIPAIMVIPASLTDRSYLSMPQEALSLQHYRRFFMDAGWLHSFALSLWTSTAAAVVSTVLGTAFSLGGWRLVGGSMTVMRMVLLLPMAVPGIVSALALFLVWTRLGLYDTPAGVVLVQVIVGLPFVVVTTSTGLAMMDTTQIRASRSLGAGPFRTLWRVALPGLKGSILVGFVLALVSGWDESVITLFVTGRSVPVLPRRIWDSLRYDIDPIVAVVASVLLVATTLGVICHMALAARRTTRMRRER